jgi:hypothetical protein
VSVYVIGVDPGDSVGLALFIDGGFVFAKQGPPRELLPALEVMLGNGCRDSNRATIAVERFTPGRRVTTHQPAAQQVIGAVTRAGELYGARVVLQGAADAHGIASNELLRTLGLWQTGTDVDQPDANDANMAIRHALLTLAREHATQFERLIKHAG